MAVRENETDIKLVLLKEHKTLTIDTDTKKKQIIVIISISLSIYDICWHLYSLGN